MRWLLTGACTLILLLATALAQDLRNTVQHQSEDIVALQKAQSASAQALEDIRRDIHELVAQGAARH